MKDFLILFLAFFSIACFSADLPEGVQSWNVDIGEVRYNFYSAGKGPALVLIHGYAETAQMWFPLMEKWKTKYTIIAPDLKGIGNSAIGKSGYDKKTVATEIKMILDRIKIKKAAIVGHDIGLMVAYAFAAQYPQMTKKLVVMDAFLPGIGPGVEIYNSPDIWHFRYHGPYAEKLVKGRERIFFDSLWVGFSAHPERFKEEQKILYTKSYSRPGRMRAGWEYFKAMPQDASDNKRFNMTKLKMPVLVMGGEKSLGQAMVDTGKLIADKPYSKIIPDCGHWMMEECEAQTIEILEKFLDGQGV
jgi:pimeloyl-ACP methyl ester carboxylesterase